MHRLTSTNHTSISFDQLNELTDRKTEVVTASYTSTGLDSVTFGIAVGPGQPGDPGQPMLWIRSGELDHLALPFSREDAMSLALLFLGAAVELEWPASHEQIPLR